MTFGKWSSRFWQNSSSYSISSEIWNCKWVFDWKRVRDAVVRKITSKVWDFQFHPYNVFHLQLFLVFLLKSFFHFRLISQSWYLTYLSGFPQCRLGCQMKRFLIRIFFRLGEYISCNPFLALFFRGISDFLKTSGLQKGINKMLKL